MERTRVEELLGKRIEDITSSDLSRICILPESPLVERKSGKYENEKKLKVSILKEVVGFLNGEGEGLLILGIEDDYEKLDPISEKLLGKHKEQVDMRIRDWIMSGLKSVPPYLQPPFINIKIFGEDETKSKGWVVLIYVKKRHDAVYYSALDGKAYQRKGTKTEEMDMMTFLSAIESKRQPIVYIEARNLDFKEDRIEITLAYKNIGVKPAMTVDCILNVNKSILVGQMLDGKRLAGANRVVKVKNLDIEPQRKFILLRENEEEVVLETGRVTPFQTPIFPHQDIATLAGKMTLNLKERITEGVLCLRIFIMTFTEVNFTQQQCRIYVFQNGKFKQFNALEVRDYLTNRKIFGEEGFLE